VGEIVKADVSTSSAAADGGAEPRVNHDALWTEAGVRLVTIASVQPERSRWLWRGRIPLGMLSMIEGDPDLGKSMTTIDIGARVSTARPMPLETEAIDKAGDVIFVSSEDHVAMTLRPRLEAASADLNRVHLIAGVRTKGGHEELPTLTPEGIRAIEAAVVDRKARLVVIDPLANHLPSDVDSHRDQEVRGVLRELAALAERNGAAVVLVRHLTKAFGGPALYRGAGSIGIAGAARSVLAAKPLDPSWRALESIKCNIATNVPAAYYRLVSAGDSARVDWSDTRPEVQSRRRRVEERDNETDRRRRIALEHARDNGRISAAELAPLLSTKSVPVGIATAGRVLSALKADGLITGQRGAAGTITRDGSRALDLIITKGSIPPKR
jgi:hypothetical protein